MKSNTLRALASRLPVILALGGLAVAVQAAAVQAPPLPLGSNLIQVVPGESPDEVKRQKRAHKHAPGFKKDPTRDDTLPDEPKSKSKSKSK